MKGPAITIGRINVSLPSGFENRAGIISRKVADNFASYNVKKDISVDRLRLPVIRVNQNDSNDQIASNIARGFFAVLDDY